MKTLLLASVLLSAAPAAAHAQSRSAEDLTRLLNGAPPAATGPAATPAPASTQAAPGRSVAPSTVVAPAPRPAPAQASQTSTARPVQAATPAPVAPAPAAPPSPTALSAAAIAALPFRIDLPSGVQLIEGRGAADARIWSARKGGKTLAMIYAGPSSQFPIYDGEQVTAAGRVSVIVPEGPRRIAMEHLFQRPVAPTEIHVWLMSLDGADRDAAERLAQSIDPK